MPKRLKSLLLTKHQRKIQDDNVIYLGFGEGVLRTFKRFQTLYGDKDHYAMNKDGGIVLQGGQVNEEKHKPKVAKKHQYTFEGDTL